MKSSLLSYIFLLISILFFSSCQQIKKSYEETLNPKPTESNNSDNTSMSGSSSSSSISITSSSGNSAKSYGSIFDSAEKLDTIQAELLNLPKFKGKEVMLYQGLYFYDFQGGRISINIQDPDIPENIDVYNYYDGKWQTPQPVKITGNIKTEYFLFPMEKLKFSVAKTIHDTLVKEAKDIEGGVPSDHVYFNTMSIMGINNTTWYSSVTGSRKDVYFDFDVDGKFIKRR